MSEPIVVTKVTMRSLPKRCASRRNMRPITAKVLGQETERPKQRRSPVLGSGMANRKRICWGGLALALASVWGCRESYSPDDPTIQAYRLSKLPKSPLFPSQAILHERGGPGQLLYLGMDAKPGSPKRGETVELTHYFQVKTAVKGSYDVFLHGDIPGGRAFVGDHAPILGKLPTQLWKTGEIWADKHRVYIPDDLPSGTVSLFVGLFKGDTRFVVRAPPGGSDGRNRVKAAQLRIRGPSPKQDLPEVVIPKTKGKFVADGKLNEAEWSRAPTLSFSDTLGRNIDVRYPTKLKLLYDDENLYVAFESVDQDITERYSKRDDPIYEHETVELFLMPNVTAPATGPYVELQASPGGVIFDASFTGRRRGMNKGFNAAQTVGTVLNGTLNTQDQDQGWVSEWVVPFKSLRGVTAAPKAGDEWRGNAFRIEKYREGSQTKGEYTAWSPPKIGDFHNIERFGRIKFGP